jgi:hypothetical protein
VRFLDILVSLLEVSPENLQIGMSHQLLESVDIHSIFQTVQGKSPAE